MRKKCHSSLLVGTISCISLILSLSGCIDQAKLCQQSVEELSEAVDKHWKPEAPSIEMAQAKFKLGANEQGCIVNIVKVKSSGVASFDDEAYKALQSAAIGRSVSSVKPDQMFFATFSFRSPKSGSIVTKVELSLDAKPKPKSGEAKNISIDQGWFNAKFEVNQGPVTSTCKAFVEHEYK